MDTVLRNHVKNFDMIIALRTHYNWKYDSDYHLLVSRDGKWQKMNFHNKDGSLAKYDPPVLVPDKYKAESDTLISRMINKNLFAIDDDDVYPTCSEVDTLVNGKHHKFPIGIDNAAGYSIWIIRKDKSRLLYYYAPEYFIKYCSPYWDRRNAIEIIDMMTKDW